MAAELRSVLMGLFTWIGRVLLWLFLFPVGVWRSLRHHRKKGEKRALRKFEKKYADKLRG